MKRHQRIYFWSMLAAGVCGVIGIVWAAVIHDSLPMWLQYSNGLFASMMVIFYAMDRLWPITRRNNDRPRRDGSRR